MAISTIGQNGLQQSRILTAVQQPAGAVLQVVNANITSGTSTSSSSYIFATNHTLSITTTVANSKIILFCNTPLQLQSTNSLGQTTFRSSIDSYTANLGETVFANYNEASSGWKQATILQTIHSPAQALGTTITYRIYIRAASGGGTVYFPDSWGLSYSYSFMAMEIAA